MKPSLSRLLFAGIMLLPFFSCRQAASPPTSSNAQTADISFNDTLHDFGIIPLSHPIDSFDFAFTNRGKGRLVVLGVETSCHCTKAFYPHTPIEPGGQAYIRVVYDGRGRQAEYFNRSVRVITNAAKECVTLGIRGNLQ